MKLDWKRTGAGMAAYEADLPPIPGYTDETGEAWVRIREYNPQGPGDYGWEQRDEPDYVYCFTIFIPYDGADVPLDWTNFGVPEIGEWDDVEGCEWTGAIEDMMSYVEWLTPEDIASVFEAFGYPPDED